MAELLREEIETIIEGELADPRIGLANVTEMHLAPDGRSARIYIAVEGSERGLVVAEGVDWFCEDRHKGTSTADRRSPRSAIGVEGYTSTPRFNS